MLDAIGSSKMDIVVIIFVFFLKNRSSSLFLKIRQIDSTIIALLQHSTYLRITIVVSPDCKVLWCLYRFVTG